MDLNYKTYILYAQQARLDSQKHLDQLGLDLAIRGHFLVCQHVLVTLGQCFLTGSGHLDGVGNAGLHDCI